MILSDFYAKKLKSLTAYKVRCNDSNTLFEENSFAVGSNIRKSCLTYFSAKHVNAIRKNCANDSVVEKCKKISALRAESINIILSTRILPESEQVLFGSLFTIVAAKFGTMTSDGKNDNKSRDKSSQTRVEDIQNAFLYKLKEAKLPSEVAASVMSDYKRMISLFPFSFEYQILRSQSLKAYM
uniref:Uncharacterized protein n=1 Tax=Romanomermis culicivorax TaxID=13658 RepID=A0A915L1P8_ROMCU